MTTKKKPAPKKAATRIKVAAKTLTPQQEAKADSTSPKRLGELAEQSTALARLVARNPSASGSLLQKLGSNSDATVRKWVTLHPNTPAKVLAKLATQFPEQLLENPVFDVLLLENPNLLSELPVGTRRSLLKREKCPVSFLEWLAKDDDKGVQLALAMNARTPAHILEKLEESRWEKVRNAARHHVTRRGSEPAKQLGQEAELEAVLQNERLGYQEAEKAHSYLHWLVCMGEINHDSRLRALHGWASDVIRAVAVSRNPLTDPDVLYEMARGCCREGQAQQYDLSVAKALARNPSTPDKGVVLLAKHWYSEVRAVVAERPYLPEPTFHELAKDLSDTLVNVCMARNQSAPASLLERLSESTDPYVLRAVAGNPNTPKSQLGILAKGNPWAVAENTNAPEDALLFLSKSGDEVTRGMVAQNMAAPAEALVQIGTRKGESVSNRRKVACHPSTPRELLEELARHKDKGVRTAAARNLAKGKRQATTAENASRPKTRSQPSLPKPVAADFSKLDDWKHLAKLLPEELNRAIQMEEVPKRQREARRRELSEAFIATHGRANQPSFKRLLCLMLPECPPSVLAKAGRSTDWKERLVIASNPNTPPAIRKRLADDGNEFVRAAVRESITKGA